MPFIFSEASILKNLASDVISVCKPFIVYAKIIKYL
jgi:hypothetical protein